MKDHYATLALARNASNQQIRSRFRELARSRHPDLFEGEDKERAEAEFQSITEAFNVLTNPERRRRHDLELSAPAGQSAADPRHLVRMLLQRGSQALRDGSHREAAANFERATQLEEGNSVAWQSLALALAEAPEARSRALSAIARACEIDTMNGGYHKLAGKLFADAGMPLRAERYYRQALEWLGDDPEIRQELARLKKL